MKVVFFYGLFMDSAWLRAQGYHPVEEKPGLLHHHELLIGTKSTVVARPDQTVYGMVMGMSDVEVERLYSSPGVVDYRPSSVTVSLADGSTADAVIYTVPEENKGDENPEYASRLAELCMRLGFPPSYIAAIATG